MDKVKDFFGNIVDKVEGVKKTIFGDVFSKYEDTKAKKEIALAEANKICYEEYKKYTQKNLEEYNKEELERIASSGKTSVFLQYTAHNSYPGFKYESYAKPEEIDARCKALRDVSQEWNRHGDLPVRLNYKEKKRSFLDSGRCLQCSLYIEWTKIELMKLKAERLIGKYIE